MALWSVTNLISRSRGWNQPVLVLSRKETQRIRLGDSIVITIVKIGGDKVRIGIDAPADVLVLRDELEIWDDRLRDAAASEAEVARFRDDFESIFEAYLGGPTATILGDGPARCWLERRLPGACFAGFHLENR